MVTLCRRFISLFSLFLIFGAVTNGAHAIPEGGGEGGAPSVTINQGVVQADPTGTSPISFLATFSAPVFGFDGSDVQLSGTAGATIAVVSGGPVSYSIAVSGMTGSGTVIANIPAGAATTGVDFSLASTSTDNTVTFDNIAPFITNVTSPNGNGTYYTGAVITITITFSEVVNATGVPQLTLETGESDAVATYSGGTGTNTLTFTYTVAAGQSTPDLNYVDTNSLTIPGEGPYIRDLAGNNADLTLPDTESEGSLGDNKSIIISPDAPPEAPPGARTHDRLGNNGGTSDDSGNGGATNTATGGGDQGGATGGGGGSVLGSCTTQGDQDIVITEKKTSLDQRTFLAELSKIFGEKFTLKKPMKSASKGKINHCDSAVINPSLNALVKGGVKMPDFSLSKKDNVITLSFADEAVFLRPLTIVVNATGATDWKNIRIMDAYGNILSSFHIAADGTLTITTNYLRTITVDLNASVFANELGVPETDTEYEAINHFVQLGIISGHPDRTYKSTDPLKRSETGKLIALFIGLKSDETRSGDQWYAANLRALVFSRIIKSAAAETLETRVNFLAMVAKAKGINVTTLPACTGSAFSDVAVGSWYCAVVQYAAQQHWLRETSGPLKPSEVITRSWAAGVLDRAF